MNIQGWFPLELTGLISLLSKRLSRVFSRPTIWKHHFFGTQPSLWPNSHPYMTTGKTIALTRWIFVSKVISLLFNMLSRFVIRNTIYLCFLTHAGEEGSDLKWWEWDWPLMRSQGCVRVPVPALITHGHWNVVFHGVLTYIVLSDPLQSLLGSGFSYLGGESIWFQGRHWWMAECGLVTKSSWLGVFLLSTFTDWFLERFT